MNAETTSINMDGGKYRDNHLNLMLTCNTQSINAIKSTTKHIYNIVTLDKITKPIALEYWTIIFDIAEEYFHTPIFSDSHIFLLLNLHRCATSSHH